MSRRQSPAKKSNRPSTAASPVKMSTTKAYDGQVSQHYAVTYSLTHSEVDIDHIQTLQHELQRERGVTESVRQDNQMLKTQLGRSEERIGALEKVRQEQHLHITSLEKVRAEQKSHIDFLVQENHALKTENESLLDDKEGLQKEVQAASTYIVQLEAKCYQANCTSLELLQSMRELEGSLEAHKVEIETLKQYIIDLKSRIAVYIPIKNDVIDKKLAEYINNYPDRQKLKIMFMRESEGVYEFGSKRVHVKVASDKIQIKVGGGFLSIDEFLDQYTPVELEKLERRDPLKRFNERVAVQKVVGDKMGVETSPVRRPASPAKSPAKRVMTGKKRAV